jgi:hypothetical protein
VIVAAAVRGLDVIQDVEKGRDDSLTLIAEYRRLRRELEVNRCNRAVGERIDTNILKPMDSLIQREFVTANADLTAVQKRLADGRRPDNDALSQARQSLANLLDALSRVRADLGEAVNLNKLRDNLRQIIERQQIVAKALQSLAESYTKALFAPSIKPVAPIELERGQSKTITHAIDWNVYEGGDLKIRFESPAGIRAPAELTVTDEKDEFEYEITAGDTAGEYTLKLLPAVGKPVEVKVLVK